jgi:hypothetical protein
VLQTVLSGFGSPQTNFFTTDIIDWLVNITVQVDL